MNFKKAKVITEEKVKQVVRMTSQDCADCDCACQETDNTKTYEASGQCDCACDKDC